MNQNSRKKTKKGRNKDIEDNEEEKEGTEDNEKKKEGNEDIEEE